MNPPRVALFAALSFCWLGLFWLASGFAYAGTDPSWVAGVLFAAFVPYGVMVVQKRTFSVPQVLILAAAAGIPALLSPVLLSDDIYRYLWDARVWLSGVDPYAFAPTSPELALLRDGYWESINHAHIPTIYPPVAQALFGVSDLFAHHPASIRLFSLLMHLGLVIWLDRSAGRRAAVVIGLNPLILAESSLGGHIDIFVGAAVLGFALALRNKQLWRASIWVGLAAGLKVVGLLLAPLIALRSRRFVWVAVPLCLLVISPLLVAGGHNTESGLGQYAGRWQGNAGPYTLLEGTVREGLQQIYGVASDQIEVRWLEQPLTWAEGSAFDPWRSFEREKKSHLRSTMATHILSSFLTRLLIAGGLLCWLVWLIRRRTKPLLAVRHLLFAALLLSPQVHPWYLLWLLPLEAKLGRHAGFVWSAAIGVAYVPLDAWLHYREWHESGPAVFLEYALVLGALILENRPTPTRSPSKETKSAARVIAKRNDST